MMRKERTTFRQDQTRAALVAALLLPAALALLSALGLTHLQPPPEQATATETAGYGG